MFHSNYIQILLNLKDVSIINFSDSSVTIQLPRKPHLCPCCHHTTNSVHDYRLQKIHHLTYCTQSFLSLFLNVAIAALFAINVSLKTSLFLVNTNV